METTYDYQRERILGMLFFLVAFAAICLGGLIGLFQALEHANIKGLYPLPVVNWPYYQGLTLHGVLNALTWTTFFICGFLMIAVSRSLERPMRWIGLSWVAFVVMMIGLVLAGYAMLTGNASVLYTFYVPMRASALHYI